VVGHQGFEPRTG